MRSKESYTLEKELKQHFARERCKRMIPWVLLVFFSVWSLLLQLEKEELKKAWEVHQYNQEAVESRQEKEMDHQRLERDDIALDKVLKILQATTALHYQSLEIKEGKVRTVFQGAAVEDAQQWILALEKLGVRSSLRTGEGHKQWNQLEIEGRLP